MSSESSFIYPVNYDGEKIKFSELKTNGDASENGLLKFWSPIKRVEEIRA